MDNGGSRVRAVIVYLMVASTWISVVGLDGVERCRTFHVYRDRLGATLAEEEPKFVQVDVQKITFPAKNHVPVTEAGAWLLELVSPLLSPISEGFGL